MAYVCESNAAVEKKGLLFVKAQNLRPLTTKLLIKIRIRGGF